MVFSIVYLSLITLLSVSPFLKIQEFKLSHIKWEIINPSLIKSASFWDTGYKRRGNSYVTVYYEYQSTGKLYKKSETEALKKYYAIWDTRKTEDLVNEFSKSVAEKIKNKDYIILKNTSHPEETQLFLSTDYFYFQGSLFYNMITSIAALIFVVLGLVIIILIFSKKTTGARKK
ncbi:hypothetical protein [Chryseobacterium paridis]|uniref:DUF3592 domain-containing protein n=1 Tax=Chryseobacterium paridis TaxID=2800328 RepID=A0ABS1FZE2_9FLAO|nr:hypothetical protein [Chryseobacterium paridis]MBK1897779.1 hypothetical protein [Chryseobacterium paridis]